MLTCQQKFKHLFCILKPIGCKSQSDASDFGEGFLQTSEKPIASTCGIAFHGIKSIAIEKGSILVNIMLCYCISENI